MQVVNDNLTARLQKLTGLRTTNTVDLLAELIDVQIKEKQSIEATILYVDIMMSVDND